MSLESVGPQKSETEPPESKEYSTFSRVAAVWIWSIFFGLNTGVTASLVGAVGSMLNPYVLSQMNLGRSFNQPAGNPFTESIGFILPFSYLGGIVATLFSWYFLYTFFSRVVLPGVFDPTLKFSQRRAMAAMRNLRAVYFWVIAAGVLRYVPEIVIYLAPMLGRMS